MTRLINWHGPIKKEEKFEMKCVSVVCPGKLSGPNEMAETASDFIAFQRGMYNDAVDRIVSRGTNYKPGGRKC